MLLNYDILILVMSFLEHPRYIRSMMNTCRTLHRAGIPYVLRPPFRALLPQRFLSRCTFLHRDPVHRFRYVNHVVLPLWNDDRFLGGGSHLTKFFQHAQHLETLELVRSEHSLSFSDERVNSAISALTSLRNLSLIQLCEESVPIIRDLQSPLRKLDIGLGYPYGWLDDYSSILARFKDTLEDLNLDRLYFPTSDTQYLRLTTLRVVTFTPITIALGRIHLLFPNLRNLVFSDLYNKESLPLQEVREENIKVQRRKGGWKSLQYLRGPIQGLYALAAQIRVEHLDLGSERLVTEDCDMLSAILSGCRPSHLSLRLEVPRFDLSRLRGVLTSVEETLASLQLFIYYSGDGSKNPCSCIVSFQAVVVDLSNLAEPL